MATANDKTEANPFSFSTTAPVSATFRVLSFTGNDEVSRFFAFDVVVAVDGEVDHATFEDTLLFQPAQLSINCDGVSRLVQGVIARVRTLEMPSASAPQFSLRLVPRMWRLRKRRSSRIFQDLDAIAVVTSLFAEHDVAFRCDLSRDYPARPYCVQYQETDYRFALRLLAEEGVSFYFVQSDDPAGDAVVVLTDDPKLAPPIVGDPALVVRAESHGMPTEENHVVEFAFDRTARPAAVSIRQYDYRRPLVAGVGAAPPANASADGSADASGADSTPTPAKTPFAPLSHYEHETDFDDVDASDDRAAIQLEQLRRRAQVGRGRTACRRIAAGHKITLGEHPVDALNQDYLVVRASHEGHAGGGAGTQVYRGSFEAIPATVTIRPRRPERRHRQVVEVATVTGPAGQDIFTDELGRVRVQFPWDPNADPEHASCWIRVAQAWSGASYGFQFVPRVGMEVLVSFLGGDVDRPVVVGCLNNATHPPTFALPDGATRSGIRTQSVPSTGGYNELSFDDTAGSEQFNLRAEHDLSIGAGNVQTTSVGANRSATVGADDTLHVIGTRTKTIDGNSITAIQGDQTTTVLGDVRRLVSGNETATVRGASVASFDGSTSQTVGGDWSLTVNGHYTVTVGTSDMGEAAFQVSGICAIGASQTMRIVAQKGLTLSCGTSSITVDEDGVTVDAKTIKLKASQSLSAEGAGPSMKLADKAEITAQEIKLQAKDSSVQLDEGATIKGKTIAMDVPQPKPPATDDAKKADTQTIQIQFKDENDQPYASKKYRLSVGGEIREGTTDGDGGMKEDVPKDQRVIQVRVWIDEFPTGRTKDYTVDLDPDFPELSGNAGAKARLKNLGFYAGDVDDTDDGLAGALAWFQEHYEIEITGKLDDATKSELTKRHGH